MQLQTTLRPAVPKVDVVAAIIRRDDKILITQRHGHVHLPGLWEFPGGKVEPEESFEAALEREIREELGVRIAVADVFFNMNVTIAASSLDNGTRSATLPRSRATLLVFS